MEARILVVSFSHSPVLRLTSVLLPALKGLSRESKKEKRTGTLHTLLQLITRMQSCMINARNIKVAALSKSSILDRDENVTDTCSESEQYRVFARNFGASSRSDFLP